MIAVSGCLAGQKCRYDGKDANTDLSIAQMVERGEAVCICPEVMGGLSIPRFPAEIQGGDGYDVLNGKAKVVNTNGEDVTEAFIKGAYAALEKCRSLGINRVILKAKSPSCGAGIIYDGSFSKKLVEGYGVTAALFETNGIKVESV